MQLTIDSSPSTARTVDLLDRAAQDIDPVTYREVSLALVAVDASVERVTALGRAIAASRGQDCQRLFMGEYNDALWQLISSDLQPRGEP